MQRGGIVGGNISGRDCVHLHAFGRQFVRHGFGHTANTRFSRCIAWHTDAALKCQQRGDVDNFTGTALHHVTGNGLGQEEQRLQICVHHRVPVFFAEIEQICATDNPGIVDEDIDPTQPGERLINHALQRLGRRKVSLDI